MRTQAIAWLACPECGSPLATDGPAEAERVETGALLCGRGHRFPVVEGIPRFTGGALTRSREAAGIQESFGSEWEQLDYATDRVWGQSVEERRRIALRELDCEPRDLAGRLVLDAGCGPGMLASLLNEMGAHVVAADITTSVDAAARHFGALGVDGVDFVQADMGNPPFAPGTFDIVFSGGVLHHNPDTRVALEAIAPLVAPGGEIYVWLYGHTPGVAHTIRGLLRRVIVPLPAPVQRSIFRVWTVQSIARQALRRRTGRARPDDKETYREKMITLLDHYTPRYRWEHTPEELSGWYRDLGFTDIRTTELTEWGFGVLARRPAVAGTTTRPVSQAAA
jgi:SAM-dependent methyltransferase/uncharacterized protein YbaR (Trm112 family)